MQTQLKPVHNYNVRVVAYETCALLQDMHFATLEEATNEAIKQGQRRKTAYVYEVGKLISVVRNRRLQAR